MRVREVGAAVAVALLLAACSSSPDQSASSSSSTASAKPGGSSATPAASSAKPAPSSETPSSPPDDGATPDQSESPSSSPSPVLAPLIGYGAPLKVWAKHHFADERFDPGAMWDPIPGLGPDEVNNDRYNRLDASTGRVLSYAVYMSRGGVPVAKATEEAMAALPTDATVLWTKQYTMCAVVQLTSASLGHAVAGKPFRNPRGQIQMVLRSGSPIALDAPAKLDPAKVTYVQVRAALAATPGAFTGC